MKLENELQTNFERTTAGRRLRNGIGVNALKIIVRTSYTILLVPLFLRAWGPETYGHWLTLTALLAYITILDFGGQTYVGNILTHDIARKDIDGYKKHLSESMSFFVLLCLGVVGGIALLLTWSDISLPGIDGTLSISDRLILFFMSSSTIIAIVSGIYVTNYQAHGLWARSNLVFTILEATSVLIRVITLIAFVAPATFAGIYLLLVIANVIIMASDVRLHVPLARSFRFSFANARRGMTYLRGSLFFWLMTIALAINNQGIILIASEELGALAVSLFATHRTIANLLTYPSTILRGPLHPELSRLAGLNRQEDLQRILLLSVRLMSLITIGMGIGALVWAPLIYPIWTGATLSYLAPLLLIHLIQTVLQAGWETSGWGLMAANAHREVAIAQIINAVMTIGFALWWTPLYGILGLALASLAGDVICGLIIYPYFAARFLKMNVFHIYGAMLRSWGAAIPLLATYMLINIQKADFTQALVVTIILILLTYPVLIVGLGQDIVQAGQSQVIYRIRALLTRN
jgi:O-antigen/teichoic acid export membrane protein